MARFGKIPVTVPGDVKIEVAGLVVQVTGPKGTLERQLPEGVEVEVKDSILKVQSKGHNKWSNMIQGTIKAHLVNMIKGVTDGWKKTLELVGTGYRSEIKGNDLVLAIGFSHPVVIKAPAGIKFAIDKSKITVEGVDKDMVGLVAAKIREVRPPDPYKGKGVRYEGEVLKLKPGKQAAKTGTA